MILRCLFYGGKIKDGCNCRRYILHLVIRAEIPAHCRFQMPSKSRRTTENFQAEVLDNNKKKILVVFGALEDGWGGC